MGGPHKATHGSHDGQWMCEETYGGIPPAGLQQDPARVQTECKDTQGVIPLPGFIHGYVE